MPGRRHAGGPPHQIRLVLADVDGTLVTQEKALTDRAIAAVRRLREAHIHFAVTSGRPPRGMSMLTGPLELETPMAAFNGGLIVDPDLQVLRQRVVAPDMVAPIVDLMRSFDLDVWIYRGADWYVSDPDGPHVHREADTVQFQPIVLEDIDANTEDVAKIVGVSDDPDAIARASSASSDRFGDHVAAAASQPYYLDVTHPDANKGSVARYLAARLDLSADEIATIGDMPNDIDMFRRSGLTIAMGNAEDHVKESAHEVTDDNENDGFAKAVERFILGGDLH